MSITASAATPVFGLAAKLRPACFDDFERIEALQTANGLPTRSRDEWLAFWKGNPAYEQLHGEWTIGWVLETGAGEIVGSIGNLPLAYCYGGRELLAAAPCAWTVHPAYRHQSLQLLQRFSNQKGVDLMIATVGPKSEPGFKYLQWSGLPPGAWHNVGFWITNYRRFAPTVLLKAGMQPRFARLLGSSLSAALFVSDAFRNIGKPGPATSVRVEPCSGFDARFDIFWQDLSLARSRVLLAVRSREALAWHYRYLLSKRKIWIVTASKCARLVAYAVAGRADTPAFGLTRMRLMDYQALSGFEGVLPELLTWILREARRQCIHIVESPGWLSPRQLDLSPKPHIRTLFASAYRYRTDDRELQQALKTPDAWAVSDFDADAGV